MTTAIDSFIDKIRDQPKFAAAAAADPVYDQHMASIEFCLREIDRRANDDPEMIDVFDKVVALISDENRTIKQRLLDLIDLLIPLREKLYGVRH